MAGPRVMVDDVIEDPGAGTALTAQRGVVRLTVNLPDKVWEAVERMAAEEGVSRTEVLRRAISTEAFRWQVEREGNELVVREPNGTLQRVRFPY